MLFTGAAVMFIGAGLSRKEPYDWLDTPRQQMVERYGGAFRETEVMVPMTIYPIQEAVENRNNWTQSATHHRRSHTLNATESNDYMVRRAAVLDTVHKNRRWYSRKMGRGRPIGM